MEIAMMLDTTGSMSGAKMDDLKEAASDLVNIVVWDDQGSYTSRVALVPFADRVNVGKEHFSAITGHSAPNGNSKKTCVEERQDAYYLYSDDAPGVGRYFNRYTGGENCRPKSDNTVMALTSDKSQLLDRINDLRTTGWTAGHLGITWAWNVLSPKWSNVWPYESRPDPYGDITTMHTVQVGDGSFTVPKLRKVAVLMTDGEFNTSHNGIDTNEQAKAMCDAMKAKNIEVYAVVFALAEGSTAHDTMSHCATSADNFYNAESGSDLKAAFRDIALKISNLRLSE